MGELRVSPEEVLRVGAGIVILGSSLSSLRAAARSFGAASQPLATALALHRLQLEWTAGAERLQDDVVALGRMTQGAAVLYLETDRRAMGMGDP